MKPLRTLVAASVVVVSAGTAVGCGSNERTTSGSSTRSATAEPTATASGPPTLAEACGTTQGLSARSLWLRTADGVRLYAVEAGSGSTTIVLAHQGRSDLCASWLSHARRLLRSGFRIVMFDFRGNGRSATVEGDKALRVDRDLAAAVKRARTGGSRRVFLIGASFGGAAAVQNGASLRVDGIISLSGTRLWQGFGINHYATLPRLRVPFLYIGARDDYRAPAKEARGIYRRVGAADKRIILYPGSAHGTDFVEFPPYAGRVRALILAWLRRHER